MLLFFRVHEEGFSYEDYFLGLNLLKSQETRHDVAALCLPGVGNKEILLALDPVCAIHHSVLIMNESDLYDYLTS